MDRRKGKAKTTKVDFKQLYCRCLVHKKIVERKTGNTLPDEMRKIVEKMLPMTDDLCDFCMKNCTVE